MKKIIVIIILAISGIIVQGQSVKKTMKRLPDTGQITSYTNTFGEDADYNINVPFYVLNGDGTVTDTVTGLMWQKTDGGEMTIENAALYCDSLTLGGYTDWRMPSCHELFSILNHDRVNPAVDTNYFTKTLADYWWSSQRQANDSTKVWVTNAGGGVGNHPKTETLSAGGTKRFNVRAVRDIITPAIIPNHFTDNGNGTVTDNLTGLIWQKSSASDSVIWENALQYSDTFILAGYSDWRLPNIKELQSVNDESLINPSMNITFFNNIGVNKYWSSTSLPNQTTKAWYLDTQFGLTTYDVKTAKHNILFVRGNPDGASVINELYGSSNEIIFPNPFQSTIHIKQKSNDIVFELFDCFGKTIYYGTDIESQDFSYLSKGIYFLKTGNHFRCLSKLVKN